MISGLTKTRTVRLNLKTLPHNTQRKTHTKTQTKCLYLQDKEKIPKKHSEIQLKNIFK